MADVKKKKQQKTDLPPELSVRERDGRLHILYRWLSKRDLLLLPVISLFLLNAIYTLYATWGDGVYDVMLVLPVVFGVWILHYLAAKFFNATNIVLEGSRVLVFASPFRWAARRHEIEATHIHGVHVEQVRGRWPEAKATPFYDVILAYDAERVVIVRGVRQRDAAIAIERALETYLGLPLRRVREGAYTP